MGEDTKEETETPGWVWLLLLALVMAMLAVALIPFVQSRVLSLDNTPPRMILREDGASDAFSNLLGATMFLLLSLGAMIAGGLTLLDKDGRAIGAAFWLGSFVGLYFSLVGLRDNLTLSELQVLPQGKSLVCSGYILGSQRWSSSALYSQVQMVTFPVSQGPRYGISISTASNQPPFCSLHNRTFTRDEVLRIAPRLAAELGANRVQSP